MASTYRAIDALGLVDCHAHLAAEVFAADRAAVCRRARAAGVRAVLVVGEDASDNQRVRELVAEPHAVTLLPCFGLHPDRFAENRSHPTRAQIDAVKAQIQEEHETLIAVGEVGLDRWLVETEERRRLQAAVFDELVEFAVRLDLPLNVHSRSAGHYTIDALIAGGAKRVLMHAFDGKPSHALRGAEHGFVFSIPPSVLRSEQKRKLVKRLPIEALALETDSPVLGPTREARNEPMNVTLVRDYIATMHALSPERVAAITTETACRIFPRLEPALAVEPFRE